MILLPRPPTVPVHYTCDGPATLLGRIPGDYLRVGDTASALDPETGDPRLWELNDIVKPHGALWGDAGPWNKEQVRRYIQRAYHVVVIYG